MAAAVAETPTALTRRMTRREYRQPPIIEALVDIQTALPEGVSLDALEPLIAAEEAKYPIREPLYTFSMRFDPRRGIALPLEQQLIGYRLWRADRSAVVQLRSNGLLCSKLPPYTRWEDSLEETQRLWTAYCSYLHPVSVTRLAVRYINRIDLPEGVPDLREYLQVLPAIPHEMRASVSNFVTRLEMELADVEGGQVVLQQGFVEQVVPNTKPTLLDLDVFHVVELKPDDQRIWDLLVELHDAENGLFESSITERTRGLFQ